MATWNIEVMAAQNGTIVNENVDSVTTYDVIQAGTGGELKTTFKALGTAGTEIGYLDKLNDDGTMAVRLTQGDAVASGVFTYDPATNTFAFDSSDTPVEGDYYGCAYEYKPAAASQIVISGNSIPDVAIATMFGLARDICNGELYPCQIKGRVQIDGNWNFDVSADGDPAVQDLSMEFVKGCLEEDLYKFTVYTEEESV